MLAAFRSRIKPVFITTLDNEVALTIEANPFVSAGGVGTLGLVLSLETFLTQVTKEVTLEAWPERN